MGKTLDQLPEHLQKIALLTIEATEIDMLLEWLAREMTGISSTDLRHLWRDQKSEHPARDRQRSRHHRVEE